jgi:hypothetical protein
MAFAHPLRVFTSTPSSAAAISPFDHIDLQAARDGVGTVRSVNAIEVGRLDHIVVDERDVSHSQAGEEHRDRASGPATADHGDPQRPDQPVEPGAEQPRLPVKVIGLCTSIRAAGPAAKPAAHMLDLGRVDDLSSGQPSPRANGPIPAEDEADEPLQALDEGGSREFGLVGVVLIGEEGMAARVCVNDRRDVPLRLGLREEPHEACRAPGHMDG